MGRLRSNARRLLLEAGVIREEFTATQLSQLQAVGKELMAAREDQGKALDFYVAAAPSAQVAVDVFAGEWTSLLPEELGVTSGHSPLFSDERIQHMIDWYGEAIVGSKVLELGPLEGAHTYMLDRAGADVFAIEANGRSFLKCLVVKELLCLQRARFALGDFMAYLRENTERYDLILVSGVLYHMMDPLELLTLVSRASDRLMFWTHYYDEKRLTQSPTAHKFQAPPEPIQFEDTTYLLHPRDYLEATNWAGFGGGPETRARWMEREDILNCLERLGFHDIEVSHEEPDHMNGPSMMLLARR